MSSLRSLFEPNLRLQKSDPGLCQQLQSRSSERRHTLFPRLVHEQAIQWIHDYSTKIMELTTTPCAQTRRAWTSTLGLIFAIQIPTQQRRNSQVYESWRTWTPPTGAEHWPLPSRLLVSHSNPQQQQRRQPAKRGLPAKRRSRPRSQLKWGGRPWQQRNPENRSSQERGSRRRFLVPIDECLGTP